MGRFPWACESQDSLVQAKTPHENGHSRNKQKWGFRFISEGSWEYAGKTGEWKTTHGRDML